MAGILLLCAVEDGALTSSSLEAITFATGLAGTLGTTVFGGLIGANLADAAAQLSSTGVARVFAVEHDSLASYDADAQIAAAEAVLRRADADILIVPTSGDAMEWVSRLAAHMGAGLATNCIDAAFEEGALTAVRSISGGALEATFAFNTALKILLLAPGLVASAAVGAMTCAVEAVPLPDFQRRVELLETIPEALGQGPHLKNARIIVSGGMGIGGAENWSMVEEAARALGAAVGATRAAVEIGWAASPKQVGFSGLKVSPDLYIAVGVSGALHHLAGIGGAKKVVAINNDPEANIFQAAHLGIVGDAKEVVPAFIARVRELQGQGQMSS